MRIFIYYACLFILLLSACHAPMEDSATVENCVRDEYSLNIGKGAILASRINSFKEFKSLVKLEYYKGSILADSSNQSIDKVSVKLCSQGHEINSELKSGISQDEISKANKGSVWQKLALLFRSPYTIAHRSELKQIHILARRRVDLFGPGDVTFYDLALKATHKINFMPSAYTHPKDSSEKGYINSFNHVTAQALITSIYGEELADFIADVHERHNMPELIHGRFSKEQLTNLDNNPVDNYVDMINNEWGQTIGNQLKEKYQLHKDVVWSAELLTNYLNDLQRFYSWSFEIEMKPFHSTDRVMQRFSDKLNAVLSGDIEA